ncbi:hypothetical protein J7M28_07670 [bacterium]|nr:hypothetical protein [bacterium]
MRRYTTILLATGMIAALVILAFAGYFTSNGWVAPTSGDADETWFTWEIHYALAEDEDVPACFLKIHNGEVQIGSYMMQAATFDRVAVYTYSRQLPEGDLYNFHFCVDDDTSLVTFGPLVE